jgi:hypothetical protein
MIHGNVPPLRSLCPFLLIAGLTAHWYHTHYVVQQGRWVGYNRREVCRCLTAREIVPGMYFS